MMSLKRYQENVFQRDNKWALYDEWESKLESINYKNFTEKDMLTIVEAKKYDVCMWQAQNEALFKAYLISKMPNYSGIYSLIEIKRDDDFSSDYDKSYYHFYYNGQHIASEGTTYPNNAHPLFDVMKLHFKEDEFHKKFGKNGPLGDDDIICSKCGACIPLEGLTREVCKSRVFFKGYKDPAIFKDRLYFYVECDECSNHDYWKYKYKSYVWSKRNERVG